MKTLSHTLCLGLILSLAAPGAIAREESISSGVADVDFSVSGTSSGTGSSDGPSYGGSGSSTPAEPSARADTSVTSTTSAASSSAQRPSNYSTLSTDAKCSIILGDYQKELSDPLCLNNAQCSSCVGTIAGSSQAGMQCEAYKRYEQALASQRKARALMAVAGALCMTACAAKVTGPAGQALNAACKVVGMGATLNEFLAMKKVSSIDADYEKWAKNTEQYGRMAAGLVAGAQALQLIKALSSVATKEMLKTAGTELTKAQKGMACVSGGIYLAMTASKSSNIGKYKDDMSEISKTIDALDDSYDSSIKECRLNAGITRESGNSFLSYVKPRPFKWESTSETAAIYGDGAIAENLAKNSAMLESMLGALPSDLKSRIEEGDAWGVAKDLSLLPPALMADVEKNIEKLKNGEKTALLGGGGDATAIASLNASSGAGKASQTGVRVDSAAFGSHLDAEVAAGGDGAGVHEEGFGQRGSVSEGAGASGATCGTGHLHEGCDRSIFHIVSDQLKSKSKNKAVAELKPVLRLNQMLAGLKVDESEKETEKKAEKKPGRMPASSVK